MPNWVYNSLTIDGNESDIAKLKLQLNKPFVRQHDQWNPETGKMEQKDYAYDNPIFAFWNIVAPTNLEAYNKQADHTLPLAEALSFSGDNWYDWNVRNWGTKWDVSVGNDDKYPDTELMEESATSLSYKFNTAWSQPLPAIEALSAQYPELEFNLSYQEETGWGGEYLIVEGNSSQIEDYENKCMDCDSVNTLDYCEDCGNEMCSSCNYAGEADLETLAECPTHAVYLDNVPEYRKVK